MAAEEEPFPGLAQLDEVALLADTTGDIDVRQQPRQCRQAGSGEPLFVKRLLMPCHFLLASSLRCFKAM